MNSAIAEAFSTRRIQRLLSVNATEIAQSRPESDVAVIGILPRRQRRRDPRNVIAVGMRGGELGEQRLQYRRVFAGASGQFSSIRRRLEMTLVILSC